ncbi:MAG: MBL fold metallo-hydrolase [Bacteroidia bacterium]
MGAARNVTGSRHLIQCNEKNILLDCGMFHDKVSKKEGLNEDFQFDATHIDYLILSHAHIDHSGCIPRLVKLGYNGPIFATPATIDLCAIMLADSARIQESDVKYKNKRLQKEGKKLLKPIYTEEDAEHAMKFFVPVPYNKIYEIAEGIRFQFSDVGHIIGSAAVHLELTEKGKTKYVSFTGDIGRYHDLLLKEPQTFPQADYILCESTYGDRLHDELGDASKKLLEIVKHTCVDKKGKLIIPAFSLGRTQEIVYTLERMNTNGLLPKIPVYVDSPLSVSATTIMRRYSSAFNEDVLKYMKTDPEPFAFRELKYIQDVEESKALTRSDEPCIIISASGMADAGRVKHHIKNNIADKKNSVLIVGYCSSNSLGRHIFDGDKEVKIHGDILPVNAEVFSLQAYSAHADYKEMLRFLECQDKEKVKTIFLVHGEIEVQENWKKKLLDAGFKDVIIPEFKQIIVI